MSFDWLWKAVNIPSVYESDESDCDDKSEKLDV